MAGRVMSFEEWMKMVDVVIGSKYGWLDSSDLPDIDYYGLYHDGASTKAAARKALKNAGE